MKNKHLLQNPIFIIGLFLLAINDHFFKGYYHNWFTGKISDFVGLLIFPMFLTYIFPVKPKYIISFVGIFFIFWKSPYSENFIQLCNQISPFSVCRIVDYSDLMALIVLPTSYYIILIVNDLRIYNFKISPVFLLVVGGLTFVTDIQPLSTFMRIRGDGDIFIGKQYKSKLRVEEILKKIKYQSIDIRQNKDDSKWYEYTIQSYEIRDFRIRDSTIDTIEIKIKKISFTMVQKKKNTIIMLNSIDLYDKKNYVLNDWWFLKRYAKRYKKLLKENLIEEMQ